MIHFLGFSYQCRAPQSFPQFRFAVRKWFSGVSLFSQRLLTRKYYDFLETHSSIKIRAQYGIELKLKKKFNFGLCIRQVPRKLFLKF